MAKRVGADGLLVVPAGVEAPRNHDVDHEFRQASQFWWLTGFGEPDAVAVLTPGHADGDYHLFVRPRDPERETWDGYRAGVDGAKDTFGADRAYPIAELGNRLPALAVGRDRVWYRLGERLDETVTALLVGGRNRRDRLGDRVPDGVIDPGVMLDELRLHKDDADLDDAGFFGAAYSGSLIVGILSGVGCGLILGGFLAWTTVKWRDDGLAGRAGAGGEFGAAQPQLALVHGAAGRVGGGVRAGGKPDRRGRALGPPQQDATAAVNSG